MALIVQKYGGTSVADPDRINAVADNVAFTKKRGNDVIVVVSAMGKATDNLIALADSVSRTQPGREMDMLLTTGERVTAESGARRTFGRGWRLPLDGGRPRLEATSSPDGNTLPAGARQIDTVRLSDESR